VDLDRNVDEWKPEKYTDDYRENLMKVIKAKMKGKEAHLVPETQPRSPKVIDLMERLRASLDAAQPRKATSSGKRRKAASSKRKNATRRRRVA
jgi:DNA end-binding protein Ku